MRMNLKIYNDPKIVIRLAEVIKKESEGLKHTVKIMHICGTHENSIVRFGLRSLLPENIKVIAGPGCPVCVTSARDIDAIIDFALHYDVKITTFGDMMKVPGTKSSFIKAKSLGADIDMVYSIFDAIEMAKQTKKEMVFFACGFETTAAPTAAALLNLDIPKNFFIYSVHKFTPNGVYALLKSGKIAMNGLILPGHAASISGLKVYERFVKEFNIPCASAGFDAVDVMLGILRVIKQIRENKPKVENTYKRVLHYEGNKKAQRALRRVFHLDTAIWRGLGEIENSGYYFNGDYSRYDATNAFELRFSDTYIEHQKGCRCNEVILGNLDPRSCPLYAKRCTPSDPIGPCMVSDEGTCKSWYDGGLE